MVLDFLDVGRQPAATSAKPSNLLVAPDFRQLHHHERLAAGFRFRLARTLRVARFYGHCSDPPLLLPSGLKLGQESEGHTLAHFVIEGLAAGLDKISRGFKQPAVAPAAV